MEPERLAEHVAAILSAPRGKPDLIGDFQKSSSPWAGGHSTRSSSKLSAGVNVGQVSIDDGDTFGRHVNPTARIMSYAKADGVIVSDRVTKDIAHRGEAWSKNLRRTEFPDVTLKGFPEPETLWGLKR